MFMKRLHEQEIVVEGGPQYIIIWHGNWGEEILITNKVFCSCTQLFLISLSRARSLTH